MNGSKDAINPVIPEIELGGYTLLQPHIPLIEVINEWNPKAINPNIPVYDHSGTHRGFLSDIPGLGFESTSAPKALAQEPGIGTYLITRSAANEIAILNQARLKEKDPRSTHMQPLKNIALWYLQLQHYIVTGAFTLEINLPDTIRVFDNRTKEWGTLVINKHNELTVQFPNNRPQWVLPHISTFEKKYRSDFVPIEQLYVGKQDFDIIKNMWDRLKENWQYVRNPGEQIEVKQPGLPFETLLNELGIIFTADKSLATHVYKAGRKYRVTYNIDSIMEEVPTPLKINSGIDELIKLLLLTSTLEYKGPGNIGALGEKLIRSWGCVHKGHVDHSQIPILTNYFRQVAEMIGNNPRKINNMFPNGELSQDYRVFELKMDVITGMSNVDPNREYYILNSELPVPLYLLRIRLTITQP